MIKILSILLLLVLLSAPSCRKKPAEVQTVSTPVVQAIILSQEHISIPVVSSGSLMASSEARLAFIAGGLIKSIHADEGSNVRRGMVLASLDLTEMEARLGQAEAAFGKADRDFQRIQNLYRDTVASLEMMQNASTALEVARNNLEMARFARKNSVIMAPSDGKILRKLADEKEIIAPGYPVFLFASTETSWIMRVDLADRDVVRLHPGDSASVSFDAYPGKEFPAMLSSLGSAANPITGTYEAELSLSGLPERIVSGLIGKASVFPASETGIPIPAPALRGAEGMIGSVYLVRSDSVQLTQVSIQHITSSRIWIKEGLQAGDTLVADSGVKLRNGQKVIPVFSETEQRRTKP